MDVFCSVLVTQGEVDMIAKLPADTSEFGARQWLREAVRFIGPGFHIDTRAEEYVDVESGQRSFGGHDCELLDEGLEVVCRLLGTEEPYDVALTEVRSLLEC